MSIDDISLEVEEVETINKDEENTVEESMEEQEAKRKAQLKRRARKAIQQHTSEDGEMEVVKRRSKKTGEIVEVAIPKRRKEEIEKKRREKRAEKEAKAEEGKAEELSEVAQQVVVEKHAHEDNEALEFAVDCKDLFVSAILNPIEVVKRGEKKREFETQFFFGGLYFVLIFVTTLIHVPLIQGFLTLLDRFKIAGAVTVFALFVVGLISLLIYFAAKQDNVDTTYKKICESLCIIMIPGIVLHLLVFIFGYFSFAGAVLIYVVSALYWMLLSAQVATYILEGRTRKANLIVIFVVVAVYTIGYFMIKMSVLHLLTNAITVGAEAVASSDGTVTGSASSIVEQLIAFLKNLDMLLGNTSQ